jgi:hypothetical protein
VRWLKHAFAVDPPGPAEPTPLQRAAAETICREIVRSRHRLRQHDHQGDPDREGRRREYRQTHRGEAPTTVEEPFADVTVGVVNAVTEVGELAGRR